MTLTAAAATHHGLSPLGWLALWAIALLWLAGYLVACRIWPFKACRRCDGNGKLRSPSGRAWRTCRRCKGNGRRLRFGRWACNHITKTAREAKS